jgi:glycosyltransferase involved in cell wall biosynthesis
MPLALIEAMMVGKACVAANIGGIPEMIDDGETGFLIDPTNPSELCDRLARLAASESLRSRIGDRARAVAMHRFSLEAMCDSYEELYQAAAGNV